MQFKRFYVRTERGALPEGALPGDLKEVESSRTHKSLVIVKFKEADDINAAIPLVGSIVYIDRRWVKLPEGSFFEQDLLDLEVVDNATGFVYGKICEVSRTGANDVYHVKKGEKITLIPAIQDVIRDIDPEKGIMKITPIKGLFEDED